MPMNYQNRAVFRWPSSKSNFQIDSEAVQIQIKREAWGSTTISRAKVHESGVIEICNVKKAVGQNVICHLMGHLADLSISPRWDNY